MQQVGYILAVLALVFRVASGPTASVSFLLLAVYASFGRSQAIQALFLCWFFVMINPGIAPPPGIGSAGRVLVAIVAFLSVLARSGFLARSSRARPFVVATALLGLFLILHSVAISPMPDVSILKVVYWLLAMGTLLIAWAGLTSEQYASTSRLIFIGLVATMIVSLPFLATNAGYLRNGHGFQGVLNHPQAFGVAMALLGAWLAGRMLVERQPSITAVVLLGTCIVLIFLSEARTAGIAMVLSVILAVILAPAFAGSSVRELTPGLFSPRLWALSLLIVLLTLPALPAFLRAAERFVEKGTGGSISFIEAYQISRGAVIDQMTVNISDRPLFGIGFGIASDPYDMEIERDPFFGLPVSASVEKGVGPLAVVEETGIIGAVFTGIWLLMLFRAAARSGFIPFVVALTALVMNMGEYALFSAGGSGLLSLNLLAWACAGTTQVASPVSTDSSSSSIGLGVAPGRLVASNNGWNG